jgi:DNA-binding NarL/FixJ family response regulator
VSEPISVVIVEDNPQVAESLTVLINRAADLRCVAHYASAAEALEKIPALSPKVALVDINLPGMNGIELVRRIKAEVPTLQVLMITVFEDAEMIFQALQAGANGYLLKRFLATELVAAITDVCQGGAPMSQQIARKVVSHFHVQSSSAQEIERLSPREHEVLHQLAEGKMYKEIADLMGISINTVRARVSGIYEKLHVQSRMEAVNKFLGR